MKTQKQVGSTDCELFAIAIATAILSGNDTTVRLNQEMLTLSAVLKQIY